MSHRKTRRQIKKQRKFVILSIICLTFILSVGYAAFNTNLSVKVKGNIVDKSRVIRSWTGLPQEDFHTDFYRANIVSATFLDTNEVPSNARESWDVSADKKKGVMAYVTESPTETGKFDLFIGAKGGVVANEDSNHLFYVFKSLKSIDFGNNFDTSNVTNMTSMFAGGNSITSLDVSSFKTDNVIDMSGMFSAYYYYSESDKGWGNRTLTEIIGLENFNTSNVSNMRDMFSGQPLVSLNLVNFDTAKVTNMYHMFYGCTKLVNLNISSFNTNNTTNMLGMFNDCHKLEELNLCSFDTKKVKSMEWMFGYTASLKKVKAGSNWTTANATTDNMFGGSGVSSVTTGQCPA